MQAWNNTKNNNNNSTHTHTHTHRGFPIVWLLCNLSFPGASLVAQLVKNHPSMKEIWIRSLGWEDPLEKGMATHSSILAWGIPWYCPWSCKKLGTRVSLVAQLVKHPPAMWETWVWSLDWEDPWRREWLPTPVFWPGKFHGLHIVRGVAKSRITTERLSLLS